MASLPGLEGLPLAIYSTATTQSWVYWLNLGIGVILGTLVGGIVLLVVLGIATKAFGESTHLVNAFTVSLLINIINVIGVIGFLAGIAGPLALIVPLLVWFGLTKVFFSELSLVHVAIVSIVAFLLSIFLVPILVGMVASYLPIPH